MERTPNNAATPPKKPGRPPMIVDREVLRRLADLDVDEKGRLKK